MEAWSDKWNSVADCIGGCKAGLVGAAQAGATWFKCDQKAGSAHCAVGWSPPNQHFCGSESPCDAGGPRRTTISSFKSRVFPRGMRSPG